MESNITHELKRQHQQILRTVFSMESLLNDDLSLEEAEEVWHLLNHLANQVTAHLVQEDFMLYPLLLKHENGHIRHFAEDSIARMGGLGSSVERLLKRWDVPTQIVDCTDIFADEIKELLQDLSERVEQEERVLFPLLEEGANQTHNQSTEQTE